MSTYSESYIFSRVICQAQLRSSNFRIVRAKLGLGDRGKGLPSTEPKVLDSASGALTLL